MTLGHSGADRPADRTDDVAGQPGQAVAPDAAAEQARPIDGAPGHGGTAAGQATTGSTAGSSTGSTAGSTAAAGTGAPTGRRASRRKRGKPRFTFLQELPFLVAAALLLAIVIKAFIVQAFYIPSGSMERTLHGCDGCRGDRVMVNKLAYHFHDIRRGDIVVFDGKDNYGSRVQVTSTGGNPVSRGLHKVADWVGLAPEGTDYIKRVIGLPGDTVACCDAKGRVTVNGHALIEPYVDIDQPGYSMTFKQIIVPQGHIFVMGDHRNDSYDSRAPDVGPIPTDDVIGRAFVTIWPPSRWRWLSRPSTFKDWPTRTAAGATPLALSSLLVIGGAGSRRLVRRTRRGSGTGPA